MNSKTTLQDKEIALSPNQQQVYQYFKSLIPLNPVTVLAVPNGCGRTTILNILAKEFSAKTVRMADFFDKVSSFHPLQIEEGLAATLLDAFKEHDYVAVDDFHILHEVFTNCYEPARPKVLSLSMDTVVRYLEQTGKKLIVGYSMWKLPPPLSSRAYYSTMKAFTTEDYAFLFRAMGGDQFGAIDFEKVFQTTSKLTTHKIRKFCHFITDEILADTESFIEFLVTYVLDSNVDQGEVEEVSLEDLYGVDEVVKQLEIDVIIPFNRQDLVKALKIRPKRGVLLYGPPGTGKTTVGRALAHRLGSKFFLLDGTVISGTNDFYSSFMHIVYQAKENAPSILFIDDCDVLFENGDEIGLYRYLLTMLDGLESKGNFQVTVIMTAMNIGSLPPALIRSGRVELWLEMKLPEAKAREAILRSFLSDDVLELSDADFQQLAAKTGDFTGADLRRLTADARNLLGYDMAMKKTPKPALEYCKFAVKQLRKFREDLEKAPAFTAAHHGKRE